jgi:hypothetical protein
MRKLYAGRQVTGLQLQGSTKSPERFATLHRLFVLPRALEDSMVGACSDEGRRARDCGAGARPRDVH